MAHGSRTYRAALVSAAIWLLCAAVPLAAQESAALPDAGALEKAAPFAAKTLSGESVGLDSLLRGKQFLVMTFWGLNCTPCIKEIARLNELWASPSFRERAGMLAVNTDKVGPKKLTAEMARRGINIAFPVATDEGYEITNTYVNGLIPLTVLIDGDRRIRMAILGADPEEMALLEKAVLAVKGACK